MRRGRCTEPLASFHRGDLRKRRTAESAVRPDQEAFWLVQEDALVECCIEAGLEEPQARPIVREKIRLGRERGTQLTDIGSAVMREMERLVGCSLCEGPFYEEELGCDAHVPAYEERIDLA